MKLCFGLFSNVVILFCFCLLETSSHNESVNKNMRKKCYHKRANHEKHFYSAHANRIEDDNTVDIKFEKLRIYFDYTHTLYQEEKIIKELIIPPVKKLLENTLKVRRFPGRLRFPRSLEECEGIPIPPYLKKEGVDSDLIVLLSTKRGLKKFNGENISSKNTIELKNSNTLIRNSSMMDSFKNRRKISSNADTESNSNKTHGNIKKITTGGFTNTNNNSEEETPKLQYNSKENLTNRSQALLHDSGDEISNVLGMSYMCLQDTYTLRPIAGVMQYGTDFELTSKSIEEAIWTTLHELTHILVMDYDLYADFIDSEFNRLGYEKTIKVKTRLKYLDIILRDRKEFMHDYLAFGRFERSKNDKYSAEDFKAKKEFEDEFSRNRSELNNNNNYEYDVQDDIIGSFSNKFRIASKNHKNKEKINLRFKESDVKKTAKMKLDSSSNFINETNSTRILEKNITKSSCLGNCTISNLYISENKNNSSQKLNILIDNTFNTGTYEEPSIKLPTLDEYYEIKVTSGFNITTLSMYIDNFLENSKIFITTPKVVEMAKKHFSCENLEGVELEHFGGLGSAFSHWSKRVLNTDYLIADSYGEYYVSNISLALFEDSGWYKVDYTKSDKLLWGRHKGCDFLNQKCIVKKEAYNPFVLSNMVPSQNTSTGSNLITFEPIFKDEFCASSDEEICSIGNVFRASCDLKAHKHSKVLKEYNYFENPKMFALNIFGDFCPHPVEWMDERSNSYGSCKNGKHIRKDLGENVCHNCRCFRSSLVEEKIYENNISVETASNKNFNRYKDIRAACYETKCRENSNGKIELVVMVNDSEIVCPRGGGLLSVEGYNGLIKCPKSEVICDGIMDGKNHFSNTSSYILSADLSNKVLKFYNDYFIISFKK